MNNLVYFRSILVWPVIVIVSWAIENLFLRPILAGPIIVMVSWVLGE